MFSGRSYHFCLHLSRIVVPKRLFLYFCAHLNLNILILVQLIIFFSFLKNISSQKRLPPSPSCWASDCELTNSRPRVQLMTDITNNVWCCGWCWPHGAITGVLLIKFFIFTKLSIIVWHLDTVQLWLWRRKENVKYYIATMHTTVEYYWESSCWLGVMITRELGWIRHGPDPRLSWWWPPPAAANNKVQYSTIGLFVCFQLQLCSH